jgi:hypothetical protein
MVLRSCWGRRGVDADGAGGERHVRLRGVADQGRELLGDYFAPSILSQLFVGRIASIFDWWQHLAAFQQGTG